MSRSSHLFLSLLFCLVVGISFLTPETSSQSTLRSLSLNGTSQYLSAPSSTSLNISGAITVEAWIKLNSIGAYQAIVSREAFQQTGTGGGYRLAVTDVGSCGWICFRVTIRTPRRSEQRRLRPASGIT
jgi:hypothetical protein